MTPNPTLVSRAEQERLLDWAAVLPIVNESYVALARGEARLLPTLREPLMGGMLGFRGADWPARGLLGIKLSAFFLSNRELGQDVWGNAGISANAIQRVASSARRQLGARGIVEILIDGEQARHFRLVMPD